MNIHILCVEDSPTQSLQIRILLESEGFQVECATTGREALDKIKRDRYHMCILDVVLPDMDGLRVCRIMRQEQAEYVPVLILSSKGEVEDRLSGLEVGADDYLPKPYNDHELIARVRALLRIKQLHDELNDRLSKAESSYNIWRNLAITDHLTGLYNRHHLFKRLQDELTTHSRYGNPLALLMIDIDHFREFNNTYGHALGDWVLRKVAEVLINCFRQADIIARYGGEEFVVLMPNSDLENAVLAAERARIQVADSCWESPAGELRITISIGVAGLPPYGADQDLELIEKADQALYRAKEQGRNRVVKYEC